ncbi:hypothetical protein Hanom_Chr10g00885541 [Helianthus anomalus]
MSKWYWVSKPNRYRISTECTVPTFRVFRDRYWYFWVDLPSNTVPSTFGTGTHFWPFSGSVHSVPVPVSSSSLISTL